MQGEKCLTEGLTENPERIQRDYFFFFFNQENQDSRVAWTLCKIELAYQQKLDFSVGHFHIKMSRERDMQF